MENSEVNITITKSLYKAFAERDIQQMLQLLHEDIEWGEPENPYNPAGGTRHGHSGFLQWINIGKNAEEILQLDLHRFLADHNSVAVTGRMKCKAIGTGKLYESDFVHLVVIENGKIKKFQEFFDTYAAGEAFK